MLKRLGKLVFLCAAPLVLAAVALALLLNDILARLGRLFQPHRTQKPSAAPESLAAPSDEPPRSASLVILNWNGKDLLEKYLSSAVAACTPADEIIVVDNASADGSADYVREHYPQVRLLPLDRNRGFGGGANAGFQAARHRIVVLLNNDMDVTPDFLAPLVAGFTDPEVFAVSAQIYFRDASRRREETGLTGGWFEKGFLRVRHEIDDRIEKLFPTFYAGGGSTAYDREKFLELGGFDPLFEPFYLEDTDLSYNAWRKGWKVLYEPRSRLYHEHRATIGKHFTREAIRAYLQKNYVLMVWKNIHRWRWLLPHFVYLYGHMVLCWLGRETETRTSIGSFLLALRQLPQALRSRRRALGRAVIDDAAVFQRTRPAVFRDVFQGAAKTAREPNGQAAGRDSVSEASLSKAPASMPTRPLHILFVSPYSIYPALHGGGVLMLQAIRELAKRHHVYVLTFVDRPEEVESNRSLEGLARPADVYLRRPWPKRHFSLRSNAELTFRDPQFAALLDKLVYLYDIDLIQFEYTQLAQYHLPLQHTPQCLFEHDVYFRSVQRQLLASAGGVFVKAREALEWLRALRFEIHAAEKFDAIFTCHEEEQRLLESFLDRGNGRRPRVFPGLRTAIDVRAYRFPGGPRQPDSLLFVGNFQHRPNVEALLYLCREVLPLVRARRPQATLTAVGAHATPKIERMFDGSGIRLVGRVDDIREPLSQYAVFVCPILTGAGVRVKILEAFASGIPVVSTPLGAEGLAAAAGAHLLLARSPAEFAAATLRLLEEPQTAATLAAQARRLVEAVYDWPVVAQKLEQVYAELVARQRELPTERNP